MKVKKIIRILFLSLTFLCVGTLLISGISNLTLDTTLENTSQFNQEEKIIVQEFEHLVDALGSSVFPGFGQTEIPTILYNAEYAFLIGITNPADGWIKVPKGDLRGTAWEAVPEETLFSQPYYRQPLPDPNITPEAFTVRVGDEWAASMQTYDWMKISLVEMIQGDLPGILKPVFPYRFFTRQLVRGQDHYITALVHERFHAYQGMLVENKLSQAEITNHEQQDRYPWEDEGLESAWNAELILLSEALQEENPVRVTSIVEEFLKMREERRMQAGLSNELVAYEQQREWLEGLARYAELVIWELAATDDYTPLPETSQLSDFENYQKFDARWKAELNQFSQMADDEGDGRFYYSGMAQAYLLDQLMPDWKTRILEEGVWLEDLLREAIEGE